MKWNISLATFLGDLRTRRMLFGAMVLGLALRLLFLNRGVWFDEAASLFVAQHSYVEILTQLGTMDFLPPLYFLILKTWMLPTANLLWAELLSVLIGTAGGFLIYRWGKVLYNERVGLFAAFLFAISCLQIRYSQEIRMYSLAVLLVMASNYYFAKVTREERFREGYSTWGKYVLCTTLALYTHYYAIFAVLAQNAYLFWRYRDRGLRKLWCMAQGAIAVLFLPWLPSLIQQIQHVREAYWIARPTFGSLIGAFIYLGDNLLGFLVLAALAVGGVISLHRFRQGNMLRSEKRNFFLIALIVIPIVVSFAISLTTQSIFYDRYFTLFAPALLLLAAKGLSHISNRIIRWGFLTATVAGMMLCLVPFYASADTDMADAAHWVKAQLRPDGVIVHVSPATFLPFQVYGVSPQFILSSKTLPIYLGGNYYRTYEYLRSTMDIVAHDAEQVTFIDTNGLNPKVERAMQGIGTQQAQERFGDIWVTTYQITVQKEDILAQINSTVAEEGLKLEKARPVIATLP